MKLYFMHCYKDNEKLCIAECALICHLCKWKTNLMMAGYMLCDYRRHLGRLRFVNAYYVEGSLFFPKRKTIYKLLVGNVLCIV